MEKTPSDQTPITELNTRVITSFDSPPRDRSRPIPLPPFSPIASYYPRDLIDLMIRLN